MKKMIEDLKKEASELDTNVSNKLRISLSKIIVLASKLLDDKVSFDDYDKTFFIKEKPYICIDCENDLWYTDNNKGSWVKTDNPFKSLNCRD